jgi:preprotein translocase subunit SecE
VNKVRDTSIWCLVSIFLVGAMILPFMYTKITFVVQLLLWLVTISVSCILALQTKRGQEFYAFAKEAYIELLKVVWPSKDEVVQTGAVVAVVVVLVSLLIWVIDATITYSFGWIR